MPTALSNDKIRQVLEHLESELARINAPPVGIVVCGGAALVALGLHTRTTVDIDIVALVNASGELSAPTPLPVTLQVAARETARALDLPAD